MFDNNSVKLDILKKRAYNLRWATVPEGVIPLTAADPDFPGAPEIANAITEYVGARYLCYGPPDGLPEFKEAMAGYFQEKRRVHARPEWLFPVDSAAFGIYITCKAFLQKGDEAIIFDPVDFLFRYSIETLGAVAKPFAIPQGTNDIDFSALEQMVTPQTKMVCLCNPLNPTGKVFTKQELAEFGRIACKHDLIILSDEIWSDIIYAPHEFTSISAISEEIHQRTIIVTGFSKSYGLAGLRIGAVICPNEAYFQLLLSTSLHQSTVHGANTIGQVAATTALTKCGYWLEGFVQHLHRMRDLCVAGLNEVKGVSCVAPEGCYVAFANITQTGKSSKEVADTIMEYGKVAVVPGLKQWFGDGAEGYVRLSFATSEEILSEALHRIKLVNI